MKPCFALLLTPFIPILLIIFWRRLEINRELERGLDNLGGYTLEYLQNNNPKDDLKKIIAYLKTEKLKENKLITHLQESQKKEIAIFDNNDFRGI